MGATKGRKATSFGEKQELGWASCVALGQLDGVEPQAG
jgi:hypothetical protein